MVNKIEQLRLEVDEIKNLLNELKNNVSISEVEKKNQAEMIKNKAEGTKQKIQNEINLLEGKTDDESMKKKDEAETLLKSFTDITNLYNSIINPENTTSSENQPETNSKNIFWKIKDRIWSQWNEITRDNLKKNQYRLCFVQYDLLQPEYEQQFFLINE